MRTGIFYWLVSMSITAGIAGLAVLLIRCLKFIPRSVIKVLWAIPLIRMVIPFGVSSELSLLNILFRYTGRIVPVNGIITTCNSLGLADEYYPLRFSSEKLLKIFEIASEVWLIAALVLLLVFAVLYILTLRELKDASHLRDRLYLSDKITTPAVYGIFRPKIILPESYAGKDLHLIEAHEKAHIRHLDNLWRVIAFAAAALHWFNPLVWLFLKKFLCDLELSCDEAVISGFNEAERKQYAMTLLDCAEEQKNVFASGFGGPVIRTRIGNILSFKKLTVISSLGLAALVIAVAVILLTNAV